MLNSILDTASTTGITLQNMLLCTGTSLLLGVAVAFIYMFKNTYTKSFVVTLALLPVIVQAVIMLVNGNLGTGVAVLGAFSLVRFRSVPGTAREIGSLFFAMAIGLATGMGYLVFAAVFLAIVGGAMLLLSAIPFGEKKHAEKELKVVIPEDLEYTGVFDDLFARYTSRAELVRVKTAAMGSLFELYYHIVLKDPTAEKVFIDELRCRNGNLGIACGRIPASREEL